MIEIIPSSLNHVGPIANNMRDMDVLECSIVGHTPKQALRLGVFHSLMCWTVMIDGKPEGMFGVVTSSLIEGSGRIWMLLTNKGGKQYKALMRLSVIYLQAIFDHYQVLHNSVHADNHKTIRWLARLGFVIGPVDVINGQPMRTFSRCVIQ